MEQIDRSVIGKKIAGMLLEIGAIKMQPHQPFSWASGWKSPIYCDNRLSLSFPDIRTFIKNAIIDVIREKYHDIEAIAGVATAGIPQGSMVADALSLPFLYVRSKPKAHGTENLIEGKITAGQKVILIEDLVSTGGSSIKAAMTLRNNEFNVKGMVSIFTYGFPQAQRNFDEAELELTALSNYTFLIEEALKLKAVNEDDLEMLRAWREDPEHWGQS